MSDFQSISSINDQINKLMKNPDTFCKDILFDGHRGHKSIRLPFEELENEKLLSNCKYFKGRLAYFISSYPDLFSSGIINGISYGADGFQRVKSRELQ